jgi:hypothetical protein
MSINGYYVFIKTGVKMRVYVSPNGEEWDVLRENNEVVSTHDSKEAAIEIAKEIALGQDAELVILRADGTQENAEEAVDPFPSEDNAPDFNDTGDEGV